MTKLSFNVAFIFFSIAYFPKTLQTMARFCEGGHICSLPRECCTEGCCPAFQIGPRQLTPPSEHVLNLFFISHWFFWCVVVAIILALLCGYSLWKKRHTLFGWGFSEHHAQSEGDSAGSCCAPPQYSRCSSFHQPPPPYTEVTSKPDLYPLVFTCNSDNGKNGGANGGSSGSSYLMVQYFRNYIIRPGASLSAASTLESLSSSFMCNVNEANTLVPPPYSRATSPEVGHTTQHYMIPRSASQLVCLSDMGNSSNGFTSVNNEHQVYTHLSHCRSATPTIAVHHHPYSALTINHAAGMMAPHSANVTPYHHMNDYRSISIGIADNPPNLQFHYNIPERTSSVSDIFVDNNGAPTEILMPDTTLTDSSTGQPPSVGTPVLYTSDCGGQPNPSHLVNTTPTQLLAQRDSIMLNSSNSMEGITITRPMAPASANGNFNNLQLLRRSLETCCQLLQQQQQHRQQHSPATSFSNVENNEFNNINELTKKNVGESPRSNCSMENSLVNLAVTTNSPSSAYASSDIKELLQTIQQLQSEMSYEDVLMNVRHNLCPTLSSISHIQELGDPKSDSPLHNLNNSMVTATTNAAQLSATISKTTTKAMKPHTSLSGATQLRPTSSKRQQQQQQNKNKLYLQKSNPNKALYIPMVTISNSGILKSPVSSAMSGTFFTNRGRGRKSWISHSAPATPATTLPPNRLDDASPLLNEHDEEPEIDEEVKDDQFQEVDEEHVM